MVLIALDPFRTCTDKLKTNCGNDEGCRPATHSDTSVCMHTHAHTHRHTHTVKYMHFVWLSVHVFSLLEAISHCCVCLLAQLKQPSTDKSPFTSQSPARKTKERDPSKEKEKHSSSKGEGRSRGGEDKRKETKQRSKDEEGRRKEGGKESHRRDQDKTRKSDKSNKSDSKPAAKGEEHLQKEDRRKDAQGARSKHRLEKERPPRHSKDASRGEPSRERMLRGAESSSEHLAVSEVSAGRSAKSVSGSQGRKREEELPSAGELSEGATSGQWREHCGVAVIGRLQK